LAARMLKDGRAVRPLEMIRQDQPLSWSASLFVGMMVHPRLKCSQRVERPADLDYVATGAAPLVLADLGHGVVLTNGFVRAAVHIKEPNTKFFCRLVVVNFAR
jgi:hypothetical protein